MSSIISDPLDDKVIFSLEPALTLPTKLRTVLGVSTTGAIVLKFKEKLRPTSICETMLTQEQARELGAVLLGIGMDMDKPLEILASLRAEPKEADEVVSKGKAISAYARDINPNNYSVLASKFFYESILNSENGREFDTILKVDGVEHDYVCTILETKAQPNGMHTPARWYHQTTIKIEDSESWSIWRLSREFVATGDPRVTWPKKVEDKVIESMWDLTSQIPAYKYVTQSKPLGAVS